MSQQVRKSDAASVRGIFSEGGGAAKRENVLASFLALPATAKLTGIDLSPFAKTVQDIDIEELLAHHRHLTSLDFDNCALITDKTVDAVIRYCRELKEISLANCEKITTAAVIRLLDRFPRLERVNFPCTVSLNDGTAIIANKLAEMNTIRSATFAVLRASREGDVDSVSYLYAFVRANPGLTELDLSYGDMVGAGLTYDQQQALLDVLPTTIRQVKLGSNLYGETPLPTRLSQLDVLSLSESQFLDQDSFLRYCAEISRGAFPCVTDIRVVSSSLTATAITALMSDRPRLRRLALYAGTEGSFFAPRLSSVKAIKPEELIPLFSGGGLPALQDLALGPLVEPFDDRILIALSQGCRELRRLILSDSTDITDVGVAALAKGCRKLSAILWEPSPNLTDEALIALADNCPELERFNIKGSANVQDAGLCALAQKCPLLTDLSLINCTAVTDEALSQLSGLTELNLYGCTGISGGALIELAKRCPDLATLCLTGCSGVSDAEADQVLLLCPKLTELYHPSEDVARRDSKFGDTLSDYRNRLLAKQYASQGTSPRV